MKDTKEINKPEETNGQKNKKINWLQTGIALFFVLLFFAFTITQLKLYKDEILPVKGNNSLGEEVHSVFLYDGVTIEQEMTVQEEENNYVDVVFKNPEKRGNEGILGFLLYDENEKEILKTVIPAGGLKAKGKYRWQIPGKLIPGHTYTLTLRTRGVSEAKAIHCVTTDQESDYFSTLKVNGLEESGNQRLRIRLMHPTWNIKKIAVMIAALIVLVIMVLIPVNLPDRLNNNLIRLIFFVTPIVCFVIVQKTCKYKIFNMKQPALNLNLWVYAMVLLLLYLIINNTKIASMLTATISFALALVNYFVSYFRGTVFVPADITAAGTAANVINSYSFQITTSVLWAGLAYAFFMVALFKLKSYQGMKISGRLLSLVGYALMTVAFINIFYLSNSLEEWKVHYKVWNPSISYNKNGFAVCFVVGSRYIIPTKPDGYTAEKAAEKARPYIELAKNQKTDNGKKPNVIAIMNEAFSDLSYDGELQVSEDYMPFIRNLKENTIKGNLHMSPFGGRTANSEYEFLTGLSMAFFPGGTVPYEHQMKHEMPSLTSNLKKQNYDGMIAMHPYRGNGYNREEAYPNLGFEKYYTRDDFVNPELLRKYISDKADYQKIIELYEQSKKESDNPFYLFNVTMQNHGGYGEDFANLPLTITIDDKNKKESAERYLNLIKKSDEAFEYLLDYYSKIDDPTIIVMFGDHQPNLSDQFFQNLIGKDKVNTLEGVAKEHVVPFVIWANYDIPEEEIEAMSVNYLSTKVAETAGIAKTPFQYFLSEMQKEIPVITGNYYIDKDGQIRELEDTKGYEEWINTYHYFQYNEVYDYKNLISDFFQLP